MTTPANYRGYRVMTLPGDGVGPEVLKEGVKVLRAAQKAVGGFELEFQDYAVGANCYLKTGSALSEAVFQECKKADAIYMGAIGIPGDRLRRRCSKNVPATAAARPIATTPGRIP